MKYRRTLDRIFLCFFLWATVPAHASLERALGCRDLLNSTSAEGEYAFYQKDTGLLFSGVVPYTLKTGEAKLAVENYYQRLYLSSDEYDDLVSAWDQFLAREIESLGELQKSSWTASLHRLTLGWVNSSSAHCMDYLEKARLKLVSTLRAEKIRMARALHVRTIDDLSRYLNFERDENAGLFELLDHPDIKFKGQLFLQGNKFFFTSIFSILLDREVVLMVVIKKDGKAVPRLLWRSRSDGSWRSTPYIEFDGKFSKGNGYHYTQETKVVSSLSNFINLLPKHPVSSDRGIAVYQHLRKYLALSYQYARGWVTFDVESRRFDDAGLFAALQACPPGMCFQDGDRLQGHPNHCQLLRSVPFSSPKMALFLPSFKRPIEEFMTTHSLLSTERSDITVRVYQGLLAGKTVDWYVASKGPTQGQSRMSWIDRVEFQSKVVNSYGTARWVIDSGALTNKPVEYIQQAFGLNQDEFLPIDVPGFKDTYRNITPVLKCLEPIRLFEETVRGG